MNKLSSIFVASLMLVCGCSDNSTNAKEPAPPQKNNRISNQISLKNLVIGMNIKDIKGAKKISDKVYMFDFEYFGEKRTFLSTVASNGVVYKFDITLNSPVDQLKAALEEKLAAESGGEVVFDCNTTLMSPDSSADISTKICKIIGRSENLILSETIIQPTEKYAGLPRVPMVSRSLSLEGTVLTEEIKNAEEKVKVEEKRIRDAKNKKDV